MCRRFSGGVFITLCFLVYFASGEKKLQRQYVDFELRGERSAVPEAEKDLSQKRLQLAISELKRSKDSGLDWTLGDAQFYYFRFEQMQRLRAEFSVTTPNYGPEHCYMDWRLENLEEVDKIPVSIECMRRYYFLDIDKNEEQPIDGTVGTKLD